MDRIHIGCDIGNVLRDNTTGESIDGSVESIRTLSSEYNVVLISKCKNSYKQKSLDWLESNELMYLEKHFVLNDSDKANVDVDISYMIDDKIKVLLTFPDSVKKIWFCNDWKKINGARKYNPEWFDEVTLCHTWDDIVDTIHDDSQGP